MAVAAGLMVIAAGPMWARGEQPVVLAGIGAGSSPTARLQHVFAGRPVSVPMVVYGASGTRADFKARLFQLPQGLAAPVGDVNVASEVDFSTSPRRELAFDVAIPPVERESRFEVVVFTRTHPSGDWRRVGGLSLRAYPNDLLKPLKRWAEQRPLRVQDPSGKLERFLTAQGISFLDSNARSLEKSDGPVITLVVDRSDNLAAARIRARRGETVVVFRERGGAFPRIDRTRWPGGSLVIVDLELLDRLAADPQAQKLFLEIVTREEDLSHERQDPD
ncbi:MAG TPA: hypothetical protein VIG07_03220 [Methylomirabilota bacterium]